MSQLVIQNIFYPNSGADVVAMNSNWAQVAEFYNGGLSSDNIKLATLTLAKFLNGSLVGDNVDIDQFDWTYLTNTSFPGDPFQNESLGPGALWPVAGEASNLQLLRNPKASATTKYKLSHGRSPLITLGAVTNTAQSEYAPSVGMYSWAAILDSGSASWGDTIPTLIFPTWRPTNIALSSWMGTTIEISTQTQDITTSLVKFIISRTRIVQPTQVLTGYIDFWVAWQEP